MYNELRQIATFTCVAETKSFVAAARKLNVSPAIVSHHVKQLEERFDVALIYRSTRRLSLTEAGEELALSGQKILSAVENASNFLSKVKEEHRGNLRVTAPTIFHDWMDMEILPKFSRQYPDISIQIAYGDRRRDLIKDEFDLAFRFGRQDEKMLSSIRILSGSRLICASPEFLQRIPEISEPKDLNGMDAVFHADFDQHWRLKPVSNRKLSKTVKPGKKITANSLFSVYRLTLLGAGVSILPDFLVREATADGRMVHLLEDWTPPDYEAHLVWPRNAGTNAITNRFVEFCRQEAAGENSIFQANYRQA